MRLIISILTIFFGVLFSTSTSTAAVTTYSDRMAYNSAAAGLGTPTNIDFMTKDNGDYITNPGADVYINPLTLRGVSFEGRSYYNLTLYEFPGGITTAVLPDNTYTFGLDMYRFYGSLGTFTVTLSTGQTFSFPSSPTNGQFFGATADAPIKWAKISFNNDYFVIDNFVYGANSPILPPPALPLLSGVVSHWPGEGNTNDVVGSNNGTFQNGNGYAPGVVGQAFSLDGVSRYITAPDSPSLSLANEFTLESRIYLNATNRQQAIIEKYDVPGRNGYLLRLQPDGRLLATICDPVTCDSVAIGATVLAPNTWYHVAAVYNGGSIRIYVNGVIDGLIVTNRTLTDGLASLKIGARGDDANTRFGGVIDEARIHNRALSPSEVLSLVPPPTLTTLRLGTGSASPGSTVTVPIELDSVGDVAAAGFSVHFDQLKLSDPVVTLGPDATGGPSVLTNLSQAGKIGVLIDHSSPFPNGTRHIANLSFNVIGSAPAGAVPLTFADSPVFRSTSNSSGVLLATEYEDGSVMILQDPTPPVITPTITGTLGNNGWYTGDVSVSWAVTDSESTVSSSTGCEPFDVTSDRTEITYTCSATSGGGTATQSVTIKRDATAPAISCGATDGAWHSADVSFACNNSDGTSGLAVASDASFSLSTSVPAGTETANAATDSRIVCDNAGNCTAAGPISGNMIDKKAPEITLVSPASGGYFFNQTVFVNYSCLDGGSLVASCIGTTANGGLLDTGSVGSKTFTVNSVDNVGNSSSTTVNYTVAYRVPTDKEECKDGGWQTLQRANGTLFNNQGDCVSYVNTGY